MLASALAITWALSGISVGLISSKVKNKKIIIVIAIFLFTIISAMHGAASTFISLFFLRLLMGLVEGPLVPVASALVTMESSEKRRGFNLGLVTGTSNGLFGNFLAPLIIVALANMFDWQKTFYTTIIPGIIIGVLVWVSIRNPELKEEASVVSKEKVSLKGVMGNRNFWLCVLSASCAITFVTSFSIFTPLYLINVTHLSPSTMSLIMAAFGGGFALFSFVVPAISDRVGRKPTIAIFGLLPAFIPLSIMMLDNVAVLIPLVFLLSIGTGVLTMMISVLPIESVPIKYAAFASGFAIASGEIIGGVLSPTVTGMAVDAWGLNAALYICAAAAFLFWFFAMFLRETAPVKLRANKANEPALNADYSKNLS